MVVPVINRPKAGSGALTKFPFALQQHNGVLICVTLRLSYHLCDHPIICLTASMSFVFAPINCKYAELSVSV